MQRLLRQRRAVLVDVFDKRNVGFPRYGTDFDEVRVPERACSIMTHTSGIYHVLAEQLREGLFCDGLRWEVLDEENPVRWEVLVGHEDCGTLWCCSRTGALGWIDAVSTSCD